MLSINVALRSESCSAPKGGGRGATNALNRAERAALTEAGRILGHPATAVAARARSPTSMREVLRPAAKTGDVWLLGEHRLVCGDATDPAAVEAALRGRRPNLMVTDPPYGVNYEPTWREGAWKGARAVGAVLNDDRADWAEAWALFPGDVAYVWHGALNGTVVEAGLKRTGFEIRAQIIWDKGRLIISRGHYHWRHEPCWYAVRKGRTASWAGDRRQQTVWLILHRRSRSGHSTEKPIEAMRRPIVNHTRPGDFVYDPFVGSGTTIIAAQETGRVCLAIELNPAYVEMAIARWEAMTGRRSQTESGDRNREGNEDVLI